jgi:hypothetical protein
MRAIKIELKNNEINDLIHLLGQVKKDIMLNRPCFEDILKKLMYGGEKNE